MFTKIAKRIKDFLLYIFLRRFEKSVENSFKKNNMKWCKLKLTQQQKKEIQDFYLQNAGNKINLDYHTYYYFRNGIFSPKYVPSSFYKAHLVGRLNDLRVADAYTDKNQYDRLFPQINHPKAIVKCINGYYYYHNNIPISKNEAIQLCYNLDNAIIKPALESVHGSKVNSLNAKNGVLDNGKSIEDLFNSYGKHFIVQERIQQHERMAALNPTSVNTIRLLTYRRENTIELLYAVVRIGRKGKIIDNESSGGLTTKINDDGCLAKYLIAPPSEGLLEKTDTGIVVEGYQIPSYEKVVEIVKEMHLQLPYFNLAGWDIAVDTDGKPVFIEWNARTELSQSAAGPAFREFTEEVLKTLHTNPSTHYLIIGKRQFNEV